MPVENILVLSTANLDESTATMLDAGINFGIDEIFKREWGYIIFPHQVDSAVEEGNDVPKCLRDASEVAHNAKATIMMFDCDADAHPGLPTYSW